MKQKAEKSPNGDLSSPNEKKAQEEEDEKNKKKGVKNKAAKDSPKVKKNPTQVSSINDEEDLPPPVLLINEPTQEEIEMKKMIAEAAEQNKKVEIPPDMLKARGYIINEIVDTELKYAWDLNIAIKYFLQPLREKNILPLVDVSRIFGNIELVKESSKSLATHLEQNRAENKEYSAIGAVVLSHVEDLLPVYTHYCSNQQTALDTLEKSRIKSKKFVKFCQDSKAIPETKELDIEQYVLAPVQRICKYPLLFKELMKSTPQTHPDYSSLQQAYESVNKLVTVVNENSREANNMKAMREIENALSGADHIKLMMPGRRFIHQGLLTKISGNHIQDRQFYLFSDMLIWARPLGKDKFEFKGVIPARLLYFDDLPDTETIYNAWEIGRMDDGKKYILYCNEKNVKAMWMQMLQLVIDKLSRVSGFFNKEAVAFRLNAEATTVDTNHQLKLIDVQNRVDGLKATLVESSRRFFREGPVIDSGMSERYLFLFSDILLITKKKSGKRFQMTQQVSLEFVLAADIPDHDPFYNCIELVQFDKKSKKYFFMVESPDIKKAWLEDLSIISSSKENLKDIVKDREAIFEAPVAGQSGANSSSSSGANSSSGGANSSGSGTPDAANNRLTKLISKKDQKKLLKTMTKTDIIEVRKDEEQLDDREREKRKQSRKWDDDSSTTRCYECKMAFTTLNRRHHCRNCGRIFCNDCSSKRAALKKLAFKKKVRVCDRCFLNPNRIAEQQAQGGSPGSSSSVSSGNNDEYSDSSSSDEE